MTTLPYNVSNSPGAEAFVTVSGLGMGDINININTIFNTSKYERGIRRSLELP